MNAYLLACRVFFENCFERGMIPINPAKLVKGVKRKGGTHQKAALTIEEAKRLLASIIPPHPHKIDRVKEIRKIWGHENLGRVEDRRCHLSSTLP